MTREEELLRGIEGGDRRAMEALIVQYYPAVLRYCLWHAPTRSIAEDAVQETFIKVIAYFDRYVHKGKFKAFLYRVAANTCADLRRKKSQFEIPSVKAYEESLYEEKGFEEAQEDLHFRYLVRNLQADLQEIVILRFAQDLTLREIGQVTGLPLRTVQSRLRSALKQLKLQLEKGEKS